ncbi:MAG TPA: histidine kinase dimerization/phospho-acceptor domain-containing protein [Verrucomicrobiae bacterium]
MKKVALVFVVAVILPSLVLAWLAVRSLRDQQFLLERQQSLLDQRVTDALAQNISDYLAQRQQEFSVQVENLAAHQNAQTLAVQFDDQIRQRWPLAEVGFCVTLAGKILSPPPNARPAAQMFRLDNSDFLGNIEAVEVYWNANNANVNNASSYARNSPGQSAPALSGSVANRVPVAPASAIGGVAEPQSRQTVAQSVPAAAPPPGSLAYSDSVEIGGQNIGGASQSQSPKPNSRAGGFGGGRVQDEQKQLEQTQAPVGSAAQAPQRQQELLFTKDSDTLAPATLDKSASLKDTAGQQLSQNAFNYKAAQTRKVSPQSQQFLIADKAQAVADESQNNLSRVIPAEAEFRQLIGNETDGMLARFLQNKLKLMFWHRLSTEPDLIFGAQLNLDRVVDGLRGLIQPDPALQNEICLALLDDNAKPVALSRANFSANWKRPFVATEIGDALPHWEIAAYLVDPGALTRAACIANIAFGLLIVVLVLAIVVGSWLIVRSLNAELTLARQKTDFVSNVSHELKTPLTSIRMFSELLAEGRVADSAKQKSYLQIITAEAARLTRLINNVLDFSRMERGEKKYNFQPCDLTDIVKASAETFRPHLEANGFAFHCELAGTAIPVRGDADALSQIIVNLLSNAEKYSNGISSPSPRPNGERAGVRAIDKTNDLLTPALSSVGGGEGEESRKEITLQLAQKQSPLPHAEIKILDRGAGIPRGSEEKIFEKFYRAHDSLSSGVQGSGLGLTIARQIARAHGGDVVYEPRDGGGSCFVLRLPITGGSRREEAQIE